MATNTRIAILDAALDLVGNEGMAGLTHRSVEKRAGLTHGSTTYHFKTKDALVAAMLARLVERESEAVHHAAEVAQAMSGRVAGAVEALGVVASNIRSERAMTLARLELFLYAARRPELQALIAEWRRKYVDLTTGILARLGSGSPEAAARFMMAVADGIELHQLSAPSSALDQASSDIRAAVVTAAISLSATDQTGPV